MTQHSPDLRPSISRQIWADNIRSIAEISVARYEEAYGPLAQETRTVALAAAEQALNLRLISLEESRMEVLKSMFATAEESLARITG